MNVLLFLIFVFIIVMVLIVILLVFLHLRKTVMQRNFGDYTLLGIIGRGGMATIYRAKNRVLNLPVAVKILDQALMGDRDLVYKFLKEGENLERINTEFPDSPVVKTLEYSHPKSDGPYFIVMDYLRGSNLLQITKTRPIPDLKTKLYIIKEVARALQNSHSLKIFHRDIAPDNIILNGNTVTLIDFGIAKQEFSDYRTMDGAIAGKPYYMSPEQCSASEINEKTDIYSLGAVLYYLVEGKPLYESKNPIEIMKMHQKKPVPEIEEDIPEDLKSFIYIMLAKKPEARPSAQEVLSKMQFFMEQGV